MNLKLTAVENGKEWWRDKWWLEEEYTRLYKQRMAPEEVDRVIRRVIEVFDARWQQETPAHPALLALLPQGTLSLRFLYDLGRDLLILEGCLRLGRVIDDLQLPSNYESALLEVQTSAHLKRSGHEVEFRPPLPNGKESDFVAAFERQLVYFEIKRLQDSQSQRALNTLGQRVHFAVFNLVSSSTQPAIAGQGHRVDLDPMLADLLGSGPESDIPIIESITQRIVDEITNRAERGESLDFSIPSIAKVVVGKLGESEYITNCPTVTSQTELKRFLRGHFEHAIEQLHREHAGLVVVQTPGWLEQGITETVVSGLLSTLGPKAAHLSAVIFLPIYNPLPSTWALFRPFAVSNKEAKFPADSVKAFEDLRPLLQAEVSTPGSE